MRIVITIEDELYEHALEMAEPGMEASDLFREALKAFIRVQLAKRLAELGGAQPGLMDVPRRQQ